MLASISFARSSFGSGDLNARISSQLASLAANRGTRFTTNVVQNVNGQISRFQLSPDAFRQFAEGRLASLFPTSQQPLSIESPRFETNRGVQPIPQPPAATTPQQRPLAAANPTIIPLDAPTEQAATDIAEVNSLAAPTPISAPVPTPRSSSPTQSSTSSQVAQFIGLINDFRQSNGKAPLSLDSQLNAFAAEHNQYQISQGSISHDGFQSGRSTAALRAIDNGFTAAENVAFNQGFDDPVGQAFNQLINSPGHRRNILADYPAGASGVDIAATPDGRFYFTQLFVG